MSCRLAFSFACGLSPAVFAACGTVTGLSDDYVYDLDAAPTGEVGGDGSTTDAAADAAADATQDTGAPDAAGRCGPGQQTQAMTELNSRSGSKLPPQCETCLASTCCAQIHACVSVGTNCGATMDCVFQCQDQPVGAARSNCVAGCKSGNFTGAQLVRDLSDCSAGCSVASGCRLQ